MKKVITLLLFSILLNAGLFGQINQNDYKTKTTGTALIWSDNTNWLKYDGTDWIDADYYPGNPNSINPTGNVYISDNTQVTLDTTINITSNIIIAAGDYNASLSLGSSAILNVGDITFSIPTMNSVTNKLDIGAGKVNCTSIIMTSTFVDSKIQNITVSTGELNISGNLAIQTLIQNSLSVTSTGIIRISNSFITTGSISLSSGSTVEFNGGSQVINSINGGYGKVILSGNGIKKLQSPISVNGDLTVNSDVELNDGGYLITGNTGKIFNVLSGATFTSQKATPTFPSNAIITLDDNSTVNFNGSSDYSVPTTPITYGNINLNNTGTVTIKALLTSTITINGNLNVNSYVELNDNNFQISGKGGKLFNVGTNAIFTTLRTSTSLFPTLMTTNLDQNSTVNFNGNGNYSIPTILSSYGAITISGTSTVTLTGSISVNGNFTVKSGVTLNDGGNIITGNTGKTFNVLTGATFTSQIASPTFPTNATITLDNNSTVNFNGTSNYTIPTTPISYGNINLNNTGTIAITATLTSTITINGNLNVNSLVELNDTGFPIYGKAGNQCKVGANASYTTLRTATSWFPTLMTTFLDQNSIVNINGDGSSNYTITNLPTYFGHLNINGTPTTTISLSAPITIKGNLTINTGTLADGGNQITGNATGTLIMQDGTGLKMGSTSVATMFPTLFLPANIFISNPSSIVTTVTYASTTMSQNISSAPVYSNLVLSTATSPIQKTIDGNITINGTFTVSGNNTLNVNSYYINCNGNINFNGNYIGAGAIKITGTTNQYLYGSGSIFNLEINKTFGNTYLNSTFIVNGDITIISGLFSLNSKELNTKGDITINNGAILTVNGGATLTVSDTKKIKNSGTCNFIGSTSTISKTTINGSGHFSYIQTAATAIIAARYYEFDYCDLTISGGSVSGGTNNLSNGTFSNGLLGSDYINFNGFSYNVSPKLIEFNDGPAYNIVKTNGTGTITVSGATGIKAGESSELDNGSPGTLINWVLGKTFYSRVSGGSIWTTTWNSALWNTNRDGVSGTSPSSSDFTNGINTFVIQNTSIVNENQPAANTWDVYQLKVENGGTLIIGDNTTSSIARTLQIEDVFTIENGGTVETGTNNTIHIINLYGDLIVDGALNLFNNSTQLVTLNLYSNSSQAIKAGSATAFQLGSIGLGGLTDLTTDRALPINGNVIQGANTNFNAGSYTHTVGGNWTGYTSGTFISTGTINFNGNTAQTISGLSNLNNITISGSAGTTFGGSSNTINIAGNLSVINSTLTIGNRTSSGNQTINILSDFKIDANSSVIVGAFDATHTLNLSGNLIVDGSLNLFKSTTQVCNIIFKGLNNQFISGTGTICNFNAITVNKGIDNSKVVEVTRKITQQAPISSVSANYLNITNGTFKLSSASILTPYSISQTICSSTGKLWINNSGAEIACVGSCTLPTYTLSTDPGAPTVNGILQVTAGTFEYGSGDDRMNLTASTSALIIDGADAKVKLYGGLNNSGTGALTITNGNLVVDCQRSDTSGNNLTSATHVVDLRGKINFTGGKLTIVDPSANTTADYNATLLIWTSTYTPNFDGSTIQFGNGNSKSVGGCSDGFDFRTNNTGTYYLGNIIINNPASTTDRHLLFQAGNAYIGGKVTVSTNSSILFNGYNMYLKGDLENNGTLNTSVTNSTLYLNGLTSKQIISGLTTSITNLVVDNQSGATPSVEVQNPLTVQTSYILTNGSLSTNGGSITLGTGTSTLTITRTDGTITATPIWNLSGVTCRVIYNKSVGSITSGNELPNSSSGLISTLTLNNTGNTVSLNTGTNITVGNLVLTSGILHLQNESITITGVIYRSTSSSSSISSGTGASMSFNNSGNWTIPANTFTGNAIELSNITINEGVSGTISNYVVFPANLIFTINGSLTLNYGRLVLGTNNTIVFQTSNLPIIRDGISSVGNLQVYSNSSIVFGVTNSTVNTAVIPKGTFYGNPSINNLTINRINGVTFGDQPFTLNGILTLTSGVLNNNGLVLSTSNTSTTPFVTSGGTLIVGATVGTTTTGTLSFTGGANNTNTAIIPDNFFASPATFPGLSLNRAGGIKLGNQDITIKGTTTLTLGKIIIDKHDLEVTTINGGSINSMIIMPSTGVLKRYYNTGATNFTFPIADNVGTTYCPAAINLATNTTASYIIVKSYNSKHPSVPSGTTDYINRYWTISAPSLSTYSYSASFTYTLNDIAGSIDAEADYLAQRYNSTTWNQVDLSAANTTTHTLSTGPTSLTQITGTLHNNYFTAFSSNSTLYYWSKKSGTWNYINATTPVWETTTVNTEPGTSGVVGIPALVSPTSANSKGITIRAGHNISMNSGYTVDQITIRSTGTLNVNTASFTVNNGLGTDLTVEAGAQVIATTGLITGTTGSLFKIDGTFITSNVNGFSGLASSSIRNLPLPSITLGSGSTIEYNGVAQIVTNSTDYGNLLLSTTGKKLLGGTTVVNGNLTINAAGDSLCIGGNIQKTLTVKGNLSGTGQINMNGSTHIMELDGSTNVISALLTDAYKSTIIYNGAGNQTVFSSPNYKSLTIAGIGTKTLQGNSIISNDLSIQNSAIFEDNGNLCSIKGDLSNFGTHSSNGNVTGSKLGKLSLIGIATQNINCGSGSGIFGNVEIFNSSITGNIALAGSSISIDSLSIKSGTLVFGISPIVVNINKNLNGSGGKINMSGAAHELNLSGQTNILSTLITDVNPSTVSYNKIGAQSIFSSSNYRNLVINEGIKQLQGTTVVNNDLTIFNETSTLDDNGYPCYVKGNIINNGIHKSTGSGKLSLTGGSAVQSITCSNFNPVSFGNLVVNAIQNSSISGSDITINGNFTDSIKTLSFTTISTKFKIIGISNIIGTISFTSTSGEKEFNDVTIGSTGKWISLVSEDFLIGGNFQNSGAFIPGNGIYTFGGSSDQIIKTPTAFNLSIKKSGGIVKSDLLTTPLLIGSLTLETGNTATVETPDNTSISGDITINGGTLTWGKDVLLNGTVDQIIDGTTTIPNFKKLTINNTFTNTDAIVLNKPISIDVNLTLTNGIIKTDATNILTMGDAATLSGISSNATFIDGPMTYSISSTNEVTKVYPIGKNNVLHKIEIMVDQIATSPTNTYTCEYTQGNANGLFAFPTTASPKAHVSSFGYWHVIKSNEVLDAVGNDPHLEKASVKLYYLSNEGISDPSQLYVAKSNGKTNLWMKIPIIANDPSSITSTTFNGFCYMGVGSDCDCNALPISLTEFTVSKKSDDVLINWETASETNNELFTLERSKDGKNWKPVYSCHGAGTTTEKSIYSYVDNDDKTGLIYYRLKQTDVDGAYAYSSIRSIRFENDDLKFNVFPNPSTPENVTVWVSGIKNSDVILKVIDNIGREIYSGTIQMSDSNISLNLSNFCSLNAGVFYTITIISKDSTISRKISVQ